jgi:hypothetical protein
MRAGTETRPYGTDYRREFMEAFTKAEGIYKDISNRYKKGMEVARVSIPIEIQGKKYREVIYNSNFLGRTGSKIKGAIYITDSGEIVVDSKLQKDIAYLAYYLQFFFDEAYLKNMQSAVADEKAIKKEEKEYEQIAASLEFIKEDNIKGLDVVSKIMQELPKFKRENNQSIKDFLSKIESLKSKDMVFNKAILDEIMPYYRNTLIKNFERIKHVNKGRSYYDGIQEQLNKLKKKPKYKLLDRGKIQLFNRIEYRISYLKKILVVYDAIIDMSQKEYIKYLQEMDERNISEKLNKIRA